MKTIQRSMTSAIILTAMLGLVACGGMSTREKNTAVGAAAGAVVGGVLTDSTGGAVGGAVVGGVIGNQVGKDKR